jgi:hypothetical protein
MTTQEKYADKINKLLKKAESTTPEEAEVLMAKAQELMAKWAIDDAMLEEARGLTVDEIIQKDFVHWGIFRNEMGMIAYYVLLNNGCKSVLYKGPRMADGKLRKQTWTLTGTGFKSDIERANILNASLQIQAVRAQAEWWKENRHFYSDNRQGYHARRQFIMSFGTAIARKLREATARGKQEAMKEQEAAGKTSQSVELVLVSREQLVQQWYDDFYGDSLGKSRERGKIGGDSYAAAAGYKAGERADVGQPGLRGSKKSLNK